MPCFGRDLSIWHLDSSRRRLYGNQWRLEMVQFQEEGRGSSCCRGAWLFLSSWSIVQGWCHCRDPILYWRSLSERFSVSRWHCSTGSSWALDCCSKATSVFSLWIQLAIFTVLHLPLHISQPILVQLINRIFFQTRLRTPLSKFKIPSSWSKTEWGMILHVDNDRFLYRNSACKYLCFHSSCFDWCLSRILKYRNLKLSISNILYELVDHKNLNCTWQNDI